MAKLVSQSNRRIAWHATTTSQTTGSFTPIANKLLILLLIARGTANSIPVPTITDTSGLTWTYVSDSYSSAGTVRFQVYVSVDTSTTPPARTMTIDYGTGTGVINNAGTVIEMTNAYLGGKSLARALTNFQLIESSATTTADGISGGTRSSDSIAMEAMWQTVSTAYTAGANTTVGMNFTNPGGVGNPSAGYAFTSAGNFTINLNSMPSGGSIRYLFEVAAIAPVWSSATVRSHSYGTTEVHFYTIPNTNTLMVFYYDGSGHIKCEKSTDGGLTGLDGTGTIVTIDATAGTNDTMLNEPIAYDPTVGTQGRLFCLYGRQVDVSGQKPLLLVRYSDDLGATWSSEHVIDDGTTLHSGTNQFYRVGSWAYNGVYSVHYAYISATVFSTDGLYRMIATYTGTGAPSWGSSGIVYSGTVALAGEPNMAGLQDGTVLVSWYDNGLNVNAAGDLYIARSLDYGATWDSSPTKITTTNDYGRPRPRARNGGYWWITANKPWGGASGSDVYTLTSVDNGVTWGTPTLRISHDLGTNTSHPDVAVSSRWVGIICNDIDGGHRYTESLDGGTTFGEFQSPFGDTSTSDAARLVFTNKHLIATGYDTNISKSLWAVNPAIPSPSAPPISVAARARRAILAL